MLGMLLIGYLLLYSSDLSHVYILKDIIKSLCFVQLYNVGTSNIHPEVTRISGPSVKSVHDGTRFLDE